MKCAGRAWVASPFIRERGRVPSRHAALNILKWYSSARTPLTLILSPSEKGEATKRTRVGICGTRVHKKQPEISMQKLPITKSEPDEQGHWGKFGGRYVPETLVAPLEELTTEFLRARDDPNSWSELNLLLRDYAGRPTRLFHAERLSAPSGGAKL